jgi:hypothetical protein
MCRKHASGTGTEPELTGTQFRFRSGERVAGTGTRPFRGSEFRFRFRRGIEFYERKVQ